MLEGWKTSVVGWCWRAAGVCPGPTQPACAVGLVRHPRIALYVESAKLGLGVCFVFSARGWQCRQVRSEATAKGLRRMSQ